MWVFGYGSLMWDGWEESRGCVRRTKGELYGYHRVFNKPSVRNWGTTRCPCPTLNISKSSQSRCGGIAFEFRGNLMDEIKKYLNQREGRGFTLEELPILLDEGAEVKAVVPIYGGSNFLHAEDTRRIAAMVRKAKGRDGTCFQYVKGIAKELHRLHIDDPIVNELWNILAHCD